jgi:hypothetical protein
MATSPISMRLQVPFEYATLVKLYGEEGAIGPRTLSEMPAACRAWAGFARRVGPAPIHEIRGG